MATATVRVGLVIAGLVWALLAQSALAGEALGFVKEGSKAAGLSACVEPTAVMRRNHMEFIKHQRDATVHGGIRSTKHSLAGCVSCHVSTGGDARTVPVNAPKQFCSACHTFAAVAMNCFDCHANVPNGEHISEAAAAAHGAAAMTQGAVQLTPAVTGEQTP